ncbi:mCG67058, partial [Mus musculus]
LLESCCPAFCIFTKNLLPETKLYFYLITSGPYPAGSSQNSPAIIGISSSSSEGAAAISPVLAKRGVERETLLVPCI